MPENMQESEEFIDEDTPETTSASAASSDNEDHEPPINEGQEEEKVETAEMKLSRKKALLQLRSKLEEAIQGNLLLKKPEDSTVDLKDVSLWGVPLMPSKAHDGTDIVLMKFLRARDFRVSEAFQMLRNTLKWRDENKIDEILDEDFCPDLEKLVIINGTDVEGHPVCYHTYSAFMDKESYKKMFGSKQKCDEYLRLTMKTMEICIKKLSFKEVKEGGVNSILHIADLKNLQKNSMRELRSVLRSTFVMLQDYYPELIHKFVMINVPFWYYTSHVLLTRVLHPSSKRKFIFARPSKVPKTLLKYVSPKDLPIQYGGLLRENDNEFFITDDISELIVRKNSIGSIQIPTQEAGVTIAWDLTAVGWDVTFKEEFIPDDECSYTVLIRKEKQRFEEGVRNSFYINEPGKIVISIDNASYKKKRVLYRTKSKPTRLQPLFSSTD